MRLRSMQEMAPKKEHSQYLASDADTEQGTLAEGMQRVDRSVLRVDLAAIHNYSTPRDRLVKLRAAHLADSNRRGDTHDRRSDQVLRGYAKTDVRAKHGTGDSGETFWYEHQNQQSGGISEVGIGLTGSHGKVQLGLGHVVDVGLDETCGLALADERRGGGDDGLGTGDVHDLEEEPGAVGLISITPVRTRVAETRTSP